jgi:hypothetical protein
MKSGSRQEKKNPQKCDKMLDVLPVFGGLQASSVAREQRSRTSIFFTVHVSFSSHLIKKIFQNNAVLFLSDFTSQPAYCTYL